MKTTSAKFAIAYTNDDTGRRRVLGTESTRADAVALRNKKVAGIARRLGMEPNVEDAMVATVRAGRGRHVEWNGHHFEILPVE
jgi:hypothetical protein